MTELRNALVTGATSFLGAALVRRLLAEGWGCRVIVRPESRGLAALPVGHPGLRVIRGDCGAPEDWQAEVQGCECFFHVAWDGIGAAGRADVGIQRRNVEMAKACLRAAAAEGCGRFVFAGSQAEYGVCDGEITEATPCAPRIEYGRGKLAFLQAAEESPQDMH